MNTTFLLLAAATATFGFLIWYASSASLRLPTMFQVQFDINRPFTNRFLRRRILMFLLYAAIPYILIANFHVLGNATLNDLGIHFTWNSRSTFWVLVLIPVIIVLNLFVSKSRENLSEFPEIRVTRWTWKILLMSAITWVFHALAVEFLFRGLLLQALRLNGLPDIMAIVASTGVYALTHYFRRSQVIIMSIIYGLLAGYIVIDTGSLLPVIVLHLAQALVIEWFSIWRHPEISTT